jgi:OmpA-OmpF porin, OOP family
MTRCVPVCLLLLAGAAAADVSAPGSTLESMRADLAAGRPILLYTISFDAGTARLKLDPPSTGTLETLRQLLGANPGLSIVVVAHSDTRGADEFNLRLTQARAEAIVAWLVQHGIAPARLAARGAGKREPLTTDPSPAAQAKNRRIQIRRGSAPPT